jgi:hypothetical protein
MMEAVARKQLIDISRNWAETRNKQLEIPQALGRYIGGRDPATG